MKIWGFLTQFYLEIHLTCSKISASAHCVYNEVSEPQRLTVRAGEWDTQTENELLPTENMKVAKVIIHEEFRKANLYNDMALLVLVRLILTKFFNKILTDFSIKFYQEKPLQIDEHVDVVCLPPQNQNFDYSECVVAGWGKDDFGSAGKRQVILKKVEVPAVPHNKCQDLLQKTRLGNRFKLHESFMCAGEEGRDACTGDGGAALMCPLQKGVNQYYQAGIVAWGIGCKTETPGVYVNVPQFRYWIDQQMDKNGFDKTTYTP